MPTLYRYRGLAMNLTTFALLSFAVAFPVPADQKDTLNALEKKLVGEWMNGGACVGDITIRADGTYERRHFSPGNNTLAGTWKVKWDALPPTLVLTCEKSDGEGHVGKTQEVKVVRLDEDA